MNMTDLNLEENTLLQFFSFNDRKIMHLRWNRYTPSYMDFANVQFEGFEHKCYYILQCKL